MKNKPQTKRQLLIQISTILLILITIAFIVWIVIEFRHGTFNDRDSLQNYIAKFGAFGPLVLTVFQAVQVVLPVLPGFFGCAIGSILFGPLVGFLCNYIGISVGSIIAFFLARRFGMPLLQDLFPQGKYKRWSKWASKSKSYTAFLFMAMLLPLFPDDFFCYLTGVSEMTAKKFISIIIIGKPWCLLAYAILFAQDFSNIPWIQSLLNRGL